MPSPIHNYQERLGAADNKLSNVKGISIHRHGVHQQGMALMDIIAFISQDPVPTYQSYQYNFIAFPGSTYWYHAHASIHRTNGLYGALVIQDNLLEDLYDKDIPDQHTLLLMDWREKPSEMALSFFREPYMEYAEAKAPEDLQIPSIPLWSANISDKGRYYYKS